MSDDDQAPPPSHALDEEASPPPTLDTLNIDVLHRIFALLLQHTSTCCWSASLSLLREEDGARRHLSSVTSLAAACSALYRALASLNGSAFHEPTQLLLGIPLKSKIAVRGVSDWRKAYETVQSLWLALASMPPFTSENETQKYLSWMPREGSSDHPIVRRALVGLSLLPSQVKECFDSTGSALRPHVYTAVGFIFDRARGTDKKCSLDFERFVRLARWATEHEGCAANMPGAPGGAVLRGPWQGRLRIIMAEHHQIKLRGAGQFQHEPLQGIRVDNLERLASVSLDHSWRSSHRQIGSFCQLVRLAGCDADGTVGYWA